MSLLPKTKYEEKVGIWVDEALQRADRAFEKDRKGFLVYDKEVLRKLIGEVIDDVMPPDAKKMAS